MKWILIALISVLMVGCTTWPDDICIKTSDIILDDINITNQTLQGPIKLDNLVVEISKSKCPTNCPEGYDCHDTEFVIR